MIYMAEQFAEFLKLDYKEHNEFIDTIYNIIKEIKDFDSIHIRYRKLFVPFIAVFGDVDKSIINDIFTIYKKYISFIYNDFRLDYPNYPDLEPDSDDDVDQEYPDNIAEKYEDNYNDYHYYMFNRVSTTLLNPFTDTLQMQKFIKEVAHIICNKN